MLLLASLLYFSFALTTASLFPLVSTVRRDLGLTYAQIGVVLGGWQLVYLTAAIPVGYLVDRFQPKYVLFAGTVVVAASQLARSYADSFVALFLAVALLGLGGPVMSVGLPKVIAEFFTGRRRATASGVYITGAHVGQMTALALTSVIVQVTGDWRITLRCYAAVVIVIALLWVLNAKPVARSNVGERPNLRAGLRHVVGLPGVWLIVAVGFAGFVGSHGYRSWLPEILVAKGMSPTEAGLVAALPALFGMIGSVTILHFGSGRNRRATATALLTIVGCAMLGAAAFEGPIVYVLVALEGFCSAALMPLMMNALMNMPNLGAKHMGAAAGIYFTIGELGGFAGPTVIGGAVTLTGSFTLGVLVLSGVMWVMTVAAMRLPEPTNTEAGTARDPEAT